MPSLRCYATACMGIAALTSACSSSDSGSTPKGTQQDLKGSIEFNACQANVGYDGEARTDAERPMFCRWNGTELSIDADMMWGGTELRHVFTASIRKVTEAAPFKRTDTLDGKSEQSIDVSVACGVPFYVPQATLVPAPGAATVPSCTTDVTAFDPSHVTGSLVCQGMTPPPSESGPVTLTLSFDCPIVP